MWTFYAVDYVLNAHTDVYLESCPGGAFSRFSLSLTLELEPVGWRIFAGGSFQVIPRNLAHMHV